MSYDTTLTKVLKVQSNLSWQKAKQQKGQGEDILEVDEDFGAAGYVHYLDYSDGFTGIDISKLTKLALQRYSIYFLLIIPQ